MDVGSAFRLLVVLAHHIPCVRVVAVVENVPFDDCVAHRKFNRRAGDDLETVVVYPKRVFSLGIRGRSVVFKRYLGGHVAIVYFNLRTPDVIELKTQVGHVVAPSGTGLAYFPDAVEFAVAYQVGIVEIVALPRCETLYRVARTFITPRAGRHVGLMIDGTIVDLQVVHVAARGDIAQRAVAALARGFPDFKVGDFNVACRRAVLSRQAYRIIEESQDFHIRDGDVRTVDDLNARPAAVVLPIQCEPFQELVAGSHLVADEPQSPFVP